MKERIGIIRIIRLWGNDGGRTMEVGRHTQKRVVMGVVRPLAYWWGI